MMKEVRLSYTNYLSIFQIGKSMRLAMLSERETYLIVVLNLKKFRPG